MNGSSSLEKISPGTGPAMLAIFAAAVAVGLAFNSLSPLGVRPSPATLVNAPVPDGPLYENDTVAVSLAGPAPDPSPPPTVPGGIYQNDTTGTQLELNRAKVDVPPQAASGDRTISWLETKNLLADGQIVLIDARAPAYYETGHIPGAISLPPAGTTQAEFAAFAARYPKDTPLVVYCGSAQCPLASELIGILTGSLGYTNVRDMVGGFVEYREAQNPPAGGNAK